MKQPSLSRREFLTASAAGSGLSLAAMALAAAEPVGPPPRQAGQKSVFGLRVDPLPKVRIGFVGVGGRGSGLLGNLLDLDGVEIKAICDIVPARVAAAQQAVVAKGQAEPAGYAKHETDYENLCQRDDIDLVYIATPWDLHVPMAVSAMKGGKHAAVEVPAAITLDECWQLVDTAEQTQRHCMMLENCCYGETEMLVLNMARHGVFGELTHGEAGYLHEARNFALQDSSATNWRRRFLRELNGNLYPTHGLGPVAQYMGIHEGDKFDVLVSMSSLERALSERRDTLPADDPRRRETFVCGDINTSLIQTARGRTVMVQFSLVMSRPYSRINLISGSRGTFCDYPPRIHLDDHTPADSWETDLAPYHDKYGHPLWKKLSAEAQKSGGHGGMDFVMNWRLIQCLHEGLPLDMTVYDAAAWSSIFPLSIASVESGSAPQVVPDFTRGQWMNPRHV
ncbi:MAG: Gfo/Idh/MocA family protein [Pirellulaceae bacterium]